MSDPRSDAPSPGSPETAYSGPAAPPPAPADAPSPFRPDLLAGRVALVTGGGTGIGRGIALELARHGADLALASRSREHLEPAAEEARALGRRALVLPFDVRDSAAVREGVERAADELGGPHVVVNNAAGNFLSPAEALSDGGWRAVLDIVLTGTFNVSRAAFGPMRAAGGGAIVNVTTTYVATGAAWMAHSGAAKAGVANLTRTLAAEWGRHGIRVNAVAPGLVEGTEGARRLAEAVGRLEEFRAGVPLGRLARVEDVARAVLFLASSAGAHVSGAELVVDGAESVGGKFGPGPADAGAGGEPGAKGAPRSGG